VSVEAAYTHLPVPPRPLIGRAREVDEARRLLLDEGARLLTLTGPGGVGKTRLALAIAGSVESEFAEGVRFVDLSPIQDPALLLSAIGRACGLMHESAQSPLLALTRALSDRNLLLVLDNCEHLLAAANDVGALLENCRGLRILATSREPLRLRLEWEFPVPPLPQPTVPAGNDAPSPAEVDALTHNASIALFVQRARAVRPTFNLNPDNARPVAELCVRLDGLPLAIELAAARTRFLPAAVLLARLERRLDLQSAVRDAPARHRTLREAIAWSYALLSPDQQAVFVRLSVCLGGCTLDAAQAVCGTADAFDALAALVERNLLLSVDDESGTGEVRFRFLETVREFAHEQLLVSGEADVVYLAHAEYFLSLVEQAEPAVRGPDQRVWLDRLEREWDNVRSVLRWLIDRADTEALDDAAQLCWSLWHFWWARGYLAEGRRWAEAILAGQDVSKLARARAAWVVSTAALDQGDYGAAPPCIEESLALFRGLDDPRGIARGLLVEGWAAPIQGDLERAMEAHRASADEYRRAGDEQGVILALTGLANTATLAGEYDEAARFNEDALTLARLLGDVHSQAQVLEALGLVALEQGDFGRARANFLESVPLCLAVGSLELLCYCLVGVAGVSLAEGGLEHAAQLLGAAEGLRERSDLGVWPVRQVIQQRLVTTLRARMAANIAALDAAWAHGRGQSMASAARLALQEPTEPVLVAGSNATNDMLTAREQEVAVLIAQGKTSKEIADALIITERTADTHAAHIRDKLGLRSRAEIAAWAVRQGLHSARES
jgi:non-specific serine/threonine protein kinase